MNDQEHICGDPNGLCDAECMDQAHMGEVQRANYYQKQMRQWRDAALQVSAERDNLHARIATLEAALAEAREDAARWAYVRKHARDFRISVRGKQRPRYSVHVSFTNYEYDTYDNIDAAIDAARKGRT